MKEIIISKQQVMIPQTWDDLTQEQFIFLAGLLLKYSKQEIDFEYLKIMFVCKVLNLKIVKTKKRISLKSFLIYYKSLFWFKLYQIRHKISRAEYLQYRRITADTYLKMENQEDLLAFNLIQISKEITFLNTDNLDPLFLKNPISEISGIGPGKKFNIGLIIDTDLTAGTYSDAMDLVIAWEETGDPNFLNYLIGLLYTSNSMHKIINNGVLIKKIDAVPFTFKYAVYLWFISISAYFYKHPVYSHLFIGKKSEGEKIKLGMSEIIIRLSKTGYGSIEVIREKNLIEYMDIQIAELQESIRSALSAGIEPSKLAEKTGRSLTQIEQLS